MADDSNLPPAVPAQPPQVSPTGAPVVSPKLVPWFWSGLIISGAVAGASQLDLGLPHQVFGWATLMAIIFAGLLGTTPGARKLVVLLVAGLVNLIGTGLVAMLIGMALVSSCSAAQRLEGSVVAVETLSDTFRATGELMESGHKSGVVSDDAWSKWSAFAKRFNLIFPAAGQLLKNAVDASSPSDADNATASLSSLRAELHGFEAMVAVPFDGGVP